MLTVKRNIRLATHSLKSFLEQLCSELLYPVKIYQPQLDLNYCKSWISRQSNNLHLYVCINDCYIYLCVYVPEEHSRIPGAFSTKLNTYIAHNVKRILGKTPIEKTVT